MKEKQTTEDLLAGQIPEYIEPVDADSEMVEEIVEETPKVTSDVGKKIGYMAKREEERNTKKERMNESRGGKVGENIFNNAEIRDGWMDFDRRLLGFRDVFYPEDWQFRVRPATVEAIRNWSTIDDENPLSVDEVFNEVIKSCLSIKTNDGLIPWGNLNNWDRLFFLLTIRDYTFESGESKIRFNEECPECSNDVEFILNSTTIDYEYPDDDVMKYYDKEYRQWYIDPSEFDIEHAPVTLYLPTLDKEEVIRKYMVTKIQNKKKLDDVFLRFLPWMAPKLPKDDKMAERKIRELENDFKMWDSDFFEFMDSVLKNISVNVAKNMKTTCPICGEEVTAMIQFPDGIRSLFATTSKHKKFGSK